MTWFDVDYLTRSLCVIMGSNTSFNQQPGRRYSGGICLTSAATLAGRCFAYQACWINMLLENNLSEACQLILGRQHLLHPHILQGHEEEPWESLRLCACGGFVTSVASRFTPQNRNNIKHIQSRATLMLTL